MTDSTILDMIYAAMMSGLVMPLVSWIKAKLPTDFPLQTSLISIGLSILIVFTVNKMFTLGMDWNAIIQYAGGTFAGATLLHSAKKTGQEAKPKDGETPEEKTK